MISEGGVQSQVHRSPEFRGIALNAPENLKLPHDQRHESLFVKKGQHFHELSATVANQYGRQAIRYLQAENTIENCVSGSEVIP
jgi:hypothetical protein